MIMIGDRLMDSLIPAFSCLPLLVCIWQAMRPRDGSMRAVLLLLAVILVPWVLEAFQHHSRLIQQLPPQHHLPTSRRRSSSSASPASFSRSVAQRGRREGEADQDEVTRGFRAFIQKARRAAGAVGQQGQEQAVGRGRTSGSSSSRDEESERGRGSQGPVVVKEMGLGGRVLPLAMFEMSRAEFQRAAQQLTKGIGVNPAQFSTLQMYWPMISTIGFMIIAFRGMEPLNKFIYDRKKKAKESERAKSRKKKAKPYRQSNASSRMYEIAKLKLEQAQQQGAVAEGGEQGAAAAAEGGEEGGEEEEQEPRLSAWRCENCGFTLYPARGREFKFFSDRFKCPTCGAAKDRFYDVNDPDEPRNQVVESSESDGLDGEDDDLEAPEEGDLEIAD